MAELCLVPCHGCPSGLVFNQEHGLSRVLKDCQSLPANYGGRQEIAGGLLHLSRIQSQFKERWEPISGFLESNQCAKIDSTVRSPKIIDMQDGGVTSELFTFPISEKPIRHEEMLHFHVSRSNDPEKVLEDVPLLANLDLQAITNEILSRQLTSPLIYPNGELYSQQPLLDFVGDLARESKITIHPDGRVEFTGSRTEMKDLLSVVAEFYLSRSSANWRKHMLLIPHFNRLNIDETQDVFPRSALKLEAMTVPLKSPEKVKTKPSHQKKSGRKARKERDLYKRNSFHTCESLLSLLMDKRREEKSTILSLKKAEPELPELLNQFSAGIAGTGIAVLFSVICKVAYGRVPFCASKLLSTGFGFGLVWLSWAVNKLSSTVTCVSRNAGKAGALKEKEMIERIDKSVKEIHFRAMTIMAVAVLKFV
ncbi:uncharacterized protein LOC116188584 [Punica granatum]|uniref:Uncharacterized protein n=2 Tax=Punica granatum TaxID=22663 RepID=A0A2I0KQ37_PUNGR|nr:uncharacterized protein LOC116188584 [Punica granatum]PKI70581.1 hypothetical protein CRG98_009086 [Punica granatum]